MPEDRDGKRPSPPPENEARGGFFLPGEGDPVIVPASATALFAAAHRAVREYFATAVADPTAGSIIIGSQRYVLVRASALSTEFMDCVRQVYRDRTEADAHVIGRSLLYDIAHAVGKTDARDFRDRMKLREPMERLAAGPLHFAYSGWAVVHLLPESEPTESDDYILHYRHNHSFEADAWMKEGRKADRPVCIMNCGYSAGWCSLSFDIELSAVEVLCCARGDEHCTFVMAPPHRLEERISDLYGDDVLGRLGGHLEIPHYFASKQREEERTRFIKGFMEAQDQERRRLARELHDEVGASLTSIGMGLRFIETADDLDAMQRRAAELRELTQSVIESTRALSRGLHPTILDDLGFETAVRTYAHRFASLNGISVNVSIDGLTQESDVPSSVAVELFRIMQEALTNAVRHGEPTRCSVVIRRRPDGVSMAIEDDGPGFDPATAFEGTAGIGLSSIRERVDLLGGTWAIERPPGSGSAIVVSIPLPSEPGA